TPGSHQSALDWFTAEHQVLLGAVERAAADGFDTHAWQLPWLLSSFLLRRGRWPDQLAVQRTALHAARRAGSLAGPPRRRRPGAAIQRRHRLFGIRQAGR